MSIRVTIRNDEPEGSPPRLAALVVTVGNPQTEEVRHVLAGQQSVTVPVNAGQFIMVDEVESLSEDPNWKDG